MRKQKTMWIAALLMLTGAVSAKITLPPMFSNNMVLQQQTDAPLWGTAKPGATVTLLTSWDGKTHQTKAGKDGNWKLTVSTPEAGGPYKLTFSDGKKLVLDNVMIGEVWICSGQSNMEMPMDGWGKIYNYEQEIAAADHPNLRLLQIERAMSFTPETEIKARNGGWEVCSPATVSGFSATAYFFGREIAARKGIAVGLIHTSWGGTNVESWISGRMLREMPEFASVLEDLKAMPDRETMRAEYRKRLIEWNNRVDEGFGEGKPVRAGVSYDDGNWGTMNFPGVAEKQGLPVFDGILWLRKEIDIPASWAGKEVQVWLGTIDDNDITYWNGVEIGRTDGFNVPRRYTVPGELVKPGTLRLAVRITDTGGECNVLDELSLRSAGGEQISLAGEWRYDVAADSRKDGMPPMDLSENPNLATSLYNAMIHPLVPYAMRGAIWYQGESNAARGYQYRELFPLMIADWRDCWGKNFPFYYAQLANYMPREKQPTESEWAELREAQLRTLAVENTGMAVLIDRGDADDIHPKDKQAVGYRLALQALARTYGESVAFSGPLYRSYSVEGNRIVLSFDHAEGGLKTLDGQPLRGFAIAGRDHVFHWAQAVVVGDKVMVSAPEVPYPVAVRYAWANNPDCNLCNEAGLPASPFRTDDYPGMTQR